jgi:hypothetical protein
MNIESTKPQDSTQPPLLQNGCYVQPFSEVFNEDCIQVMKRYPDKFFDLAVVDPPYGIGYDGQRKSTSKHGGRRAKEFKGWDNQTPEQDYWDELFRVSKNQIVWGQITSHNTYHLQWDGYFGIKDREFVIQTVSLHTVRFKGL